MPDSDNRRNDRKNFLQKFMYEVSAVGREFTTLCHEASSLNISQGGLGFMTSQALKAGSIVKLLLPVSETQTPLPVFAEVRWSEPSGGLFRTGVRFLS